MSNIDRAAEVIQKKLGCMTLSAEDTARRLANAGLLAEDLPEPYVVAGVGDADVTAWQPCHTIMRTDFTGGAASEVEIPAGNVWIEHDSIVAFDVDHSEMHLGTGEARALALALLAAAEHAETEVTDG